MGHLWRPFCLPPSLTSSSAFLSWLYLTCFCVFLKHLIILKSNLWRFSDLLRHLQFFFIIELACSCVIEILFQSLLNFFGISFHLESQAIVIFWTICSLSFRILRNLQRYFFPYLYLSTVNLEKQILIDSFTL